MERLRQLLQSLVGKKHPSGQDNLTIFDHRTRKTVFIPIDDLQHCFRFNAEEMAQLKDSDRNPLQIYDPGYKYTLASTSSICFVDGFSGKLQYRGYPIDQLAARSSFLEIAFLLIYGQLPSGAQLSSFTTNISSRSIMHEGIKRLVNSFRSSAHPMGMLVSALYALSTFVPEANTSINGEAVYRNPILRNNQYVQILGLLPTLVAFIYSHTEGKPSNPPNPTLSYVQNLLFMLYRQNEHEFRPHPRVVKAVETLFIIHAEHEFSNSTALVIHLASTGVDIYTAIAAGAGALFGSKHGGSSAAVIKMLEAIGSRENIPKFLMQVRQKSRLLFGFGHSIYRDNDPRAQMVRVVAEEMFKIMGKEPLIKLAIELERIALTDQYFVTRKLFPNVDFYTAMVYYTIGIPTNLFSLLYCVPKIAGWLAHWAEFQQDPDARMIRPKQNYLGYGRRQFIEKNEREDHFLNPELASSKLRARREAAQHYNHHSE